MTRHDRFTSKKGEAAAHVIMQSTRVTLKDVSSNHGNYLELKFTSYTGSMYEATGMHLAELQPVGLPRNCSLVAKFDGHKRRPCG